ncbi:TPA: hypothetical protein EYP66_21265 [Candidatus Poribacteria bacterium]|nr:hypothetical protein [Candidatus Poribacteria bacterium]
MRITSVIILLFAITLRSFAGLTEEDLQKIGYLIDRKLEPIKLDIAEMKAKMVTKDEILAIKDEIIAIKLDIAEMKGKMATKDDIIATRQNLNERMDTLYGVLIGVLIAIIVVILSIIFTPFLRKWVERREQVRVENELEELKTTREAEEKRKETARRIVEERPEFEEAYKAVGLL